MWIEQLDMAKRNFGYTNQRSPDLVLVFGDTSSLSNSINKRDSFRELVTTFPRAEFIGCSTGSSIHKDRIVESGIVATAVGFERTKLRSAVERLEDHDTDFALGKALALQLADDDLKTIFLLSDGLDVNGSELIDGLTSTLGQAVTMSGGMAGDGARFLQTLVVDGKTPREGIAKAIGLYGNALRIGHGSSGGWFDFGPTRIITQSGGNVLLSLDNKPALDLYERYLGEEEASNLPASGLYFPLRIWHPKNPTHEVVRTLLSIDRKKGTMTFAGDVPMGWQARLMRGRIDNLIEGATAAAKHARDEIGTDTTNPSLAIAVSCVGRRLLMGQRTEDEIVALREVIGRSTVLAGFYSHGEIAPHNISHQSCLQNQTMTITLIAEMT